MLPPENKNRSSKELITHIVEKLGNNEEPYKIGAWENFNNNKKNEFVFWLKSTAAILILAFIMFYLLGTGKQNINQNYAIFKKNKINEVLNYSKTSVKKIIKTNQNIGLKQEKIYGSTSNLSNPKTQNLQVKVSTKINKQITNNLAEINHNIGIKNVANYQFNFTPNYKKPPTLLTPIFAKTNKQKNNNLVSIKQNNVLNPGKNYQAAFAHSNQITFNINLQVDLKTKNTKTNLLYIKASNKDINNIKTNELEKNTKYLISKLSDTSNQTLTQILNNKPLTNYKADSVVLQDNKSNLKPNKISSEEFFAAQTKILAQPKKSKKSNNWLLGFAIAPSVGNTPKLNMGYGLNIEYAVSSKISINSGVAYNQLSTTKSFENANVFTEIIGIRSPDITIKNLESINANMSGIDVPLEIKYYLNKSFYANAGISVFAILTQQQNNNFIEEKLVTQLTVSENGEQQENSFLTYERITQQVSKSQNSVPNYLSFYNLSFGYRQKISKKYFVAFEPFVKLPVKEITAERLNLIGAGLRLRFNF